MRQSKPTISDSDRAAVSAALKQAKLVNASRRLGRVVKHVNPDSKTQAKRKKLEGNLSEWMRYHGGEAFASDWSPDHLRSLQKIETAIEKGGLFALAMPRGHGKTTILKWTLLYVLLTGKRRYVVVVAATADMAQSLIEFARQQIQESESLHEHYPHITTYARATDGKAIKARFQLRADMKTTGIMWSKNTLVFPDVADPDHPDKSYPACGAILEGHGLTGSIRGKWRDTKTGKVLRPDFVILDDPQDRESAESETQCNMRERIITGDVLGLAGPKKKIAAVMPCTIIRKGDLADRFLSHELHPEWQGEISSLVNTWPKAQKTLWAEYANIYRTETSEGRGFDKATEFYLLNRVAMDEGASVSWDERVRDGEVSALQTAENLLLETGPQFWAEYQNDPKSASGAQYDLTPQLICKHMSPLPRLHLPAESTVFVGHCDINRSGLHWCLAAFDQQMTGHAVLYGKYPQNKDLWAKNASEHDRKQAIFKGLVELGNMINNTQFTQNGKVVRLGLLLVDLGYERDVVHRFANFSQYSFKILPSGGRAAHKYWVTRATLVGKPMEGCHVVKADAGHYLVFNADQWRETAQRAFLSEPGAPGGFTLHHADSSFYHVPFAEQVCAEKLNNKYETDKGMRWEWVHQPGSVWDWGDAYTGCWVAAAASGLSASGMSAIVKPKKKANVVIRRPGG